LHRTFLDGRDDAMRIVILTWMLITALGAAGCGRGRRAAAPPPPPDSTFTPETEAEDGSFLGSEDLGEDEDLDGVGGPVDEEPEAGVPGEDTDGEEDGEPAEVLRDVAYGDHEKQRLDIHGAGGAGKPVMVYVHGGGWQVGDKSRVHHKADFLTGEGYLFVSVNYRLTPEVQHPGHAVDVAAAVAWAFDNAEEYGGDPGRVFLMGHSAGAHLVALVAAAPSYLEAHGRSPGDLSGVVLLDGAGYDIPLLRELNPRQFQRTYAPVFGEDPAVLEEASPASHVAPGMAPHLVLHVDRRMGRLQSEHYAEAMESSGVSAEVHEVAGKDHRGINVDLGAPDEPMNDLVLGFLASQ
jgi:acetyl esterase/lipase